MVAGVHTGCALLAYGALLFSTANRSCARDYITQLDGVEDVSSNTLVHSSGEDAQQLRLLSPDANVDQLGRTKQDVQYFGITVDECECR